MPTPMLRGWEKLVELTPTGKGWRGVDRLRNGRADSGGLAGAVQRHASATALLWNEKHKRIIRSPRPPPIDLLHRRHLPTPGWRPDATTLPRTLRPAVNGWEWDGSSIGQGTKPGMHRTCRASHASHVASYHRVTATAWGQTRVWPSRTFRKGDDE